MLQSFDVLDLSITLTPPPTEAPADVLANITLRCEALGLYHKAGLLTDPLTQQERAELRWYLEEYPLWPYAEFASRGKRIEAHLADIGKRLYQTVFGGALDLVQSWQFQPARQRQISVISRVPAALSLPWELLHDEQGYLVLRTRHPVALLRRLEQRSLGTLLTEFEPPLRVLVVTARPSDTKFFDPRSLARELLDVVQSQIDAGAIDAEFLRPPTREALHKRLQDETHPVHVLHFDGHGTFDGSPGTQQTLRKQGWLAFENAQGKLDLVSADDLAQLLQDSGIKLVILDACQSAMSSADDAFSSVAARLIKGGVDATIAMSASVLVVTSARFFARFYHELSIGTPVPLAQERARQHLFHDPRRHFFRRRADEESQPVELRDWWLPHYYQQRPLTLRASRVPKRRASPPPALPRFNGDMPPGPRYSFSGRARELLQIERHLLRKRMIVVSGFGGIGKTALAREAADWLTRTGMYQRACFVSFEGGRANAISLLSQLGFLLRVYDGTYTPNDPKEALERLQEALKEQRLLVIADNLESILPGGEAPLEPEERAQLWDVPLELQRLGVGVLLTSSNTAFSDERLAEGARVAHLPLAGLEPDAAYVLASSLLESLRIDRSSAPYDLLREMLQQLDHHPLAIQLVLPALRSCSLVQIQQDFSELLPRFIDDMETGHNRSLVASLEYSIQRLSEAQRALLPRLALFEGGTYEEDLLAITKIPKREWVDLRQALEQGALCFAERIEGFTSPFLHFHPVLTPYLRTQPGASDAALHERYAQCYADRITSFYDEDRQYPQEVRTLVKKELPNLRKALELLLATGEIEVSAGMAESISLFLTAFGLLRERDELRQRVSKALAGQHSTEHGMLTYAEYLHESGLAEDELGRGNEHAAHDRLTHLLTRIELLPEGTALGSGSHAHCETLLNLSRCLQPVEAEACLRRALQIVDLLIKQKPGEKSSIRLRGAVLNGLVTPLFSQGKYALARDVSEEALEVAKQLGDKKYQVETYVQLGVLALYQSDYVEAESRFGTAVQDFRMLHMPAREADMWLGLGGVAEKQEDWIKAERCFRRGLAIYEQLGDTHQASGACNLLAKISRMTGRTDEAEGWYKRALELNRLASPDNPDPDFLTPLADLLVNEVQAGRASALRLAEAKGYAKQALAVSATWEILDVLARIAENEGQAEEARMYRRRANESGGA